MEEMLSEEIISFLTKNIKKHELVKRLQHSNVSVGDYNKIIIKVIRNQQHRRHPRSKTINLSTILDNEYLAEVDTDNVRIIAETTDSISKIYSDLGNGLFNVPFLGDKKRLLREAEMKIRAEVFAKHFGLELEDGCIRMLMKACELYIGREMPK